MDKKYIAAVYFTDSQDNNHAYNVGDVFPRQGKTVSKGRLDALSSSNNNAKKPVIAAIKDAEEDIADNPTKYSKEQLETMKVSEIGVIIKERDYQINTFGKKKTEIIEEFLEKQV